MIVSLCLGSAGVQEAESVCFMTDRDRVEEELDLTDELRRLLEEVSAFPVDHYHDLRPVFNRLRIEGTNIELHELVQLRDSLLTIRSLVQCITRQEKEKFPRLGMLGEQVKVHPFVPDTISTILSPRGEIRDKASAELAAIRRDLRQKQEQVNVRIHQIMKEAQQAGFVEKDITLAVRNGRLVIPVNAAMKRRIGGFVHDESATGKTVYIEPAEVVELNNDIVELEYAEKREIQRILRRFTDQIRPYFDDLSAAYHFLGRMDFTRAKALLARQTGSIRPAINDQYLLRWVAACHPLLLVNFRREGKTVVPLDIELNSRNRILVISGPNAGGKSVCLQTVGLLQYMVQCGLLVPALEGSTTTLFSRLFIEMGDDQSIENDLSTYSSHLMHMKHIVKQAATGSLVLIDEFGSGTEPQLGGAIAESILAHLAATGCLGLVTTHYTNLKHFAASTDGVENGAMMFDTRQIQPLFRLEIGRPGSSFAFEIARKIGLPENILQQAANKVGKDHVEFDRHLKDIARDKHYIGQKREQMRISGKELEKTLERYRRELEETEKQRKQIIEKARQEARDLLDAANRQIENTIRQIREAQAEKEATKRARAGVEELRDGINREDDTTSGRVKEKIRTVSSLQKKLREKEGRPQELQQKTEPIHDRGFQPGDTVKMEGQEMPGEVISVTGKSVVVSFGQIIMSVDEKRLVRPGPAEKEVFLVRQRQGGSYGYDLLQKKLAFRPEIDIRGSRGEEALRKVIDFIDDAVMVGATEVRILHGKGDGILRQIIREYLHTVNVVRSFRDEHVERGGAGITVVTLED